MSDMKSIFSADPKSTFALLSQPGLGFYVPAYQRPYSWGKDNTLRLVDDVVRGVAMMHPAGDAITFLGTMILIHDIKYQTVEPQVKGELPTRVMLVIDGQQRITTLLLLNAALHGELSARIAVLSRKSAEKDFGLEWIRQRAIQTRAELAMTLYQDMNYGEEEYRFYPRVIRAYDDSWSRRKTEVRYQSAVAQFLHNYGVHARQNESKIEGKQFQPNFSDISGAHKSLVDNWKAIRSQLRVLAVGELEDMPEPYEIGQLSEEAMFQQPLPDEVLSLAKGNGANEPKTKETGRELLRLVLFARYLLERAAVTEVVAKDDNYAFDIFEALNTSGEPLTAYDTFKPRVIKAEGQACYEKSPSYETMSVVERYLDQYKKAPDKHDATSRLLIPFALAENGKRLSKRLNVQRRYLKDEYEKLASKDGAKEASKEAQRLFVRHLSYTADFLSSAWPDDSECNATLPELGELGEQERQLTTTCLEVLRSAKHAVTIGPLLRFYAAVRLASGSERRQAVQDLAAAIRCVTAFLALWRGPKTTTSNIDQQYRALMTKGFGDVGPFSRRPADKPTATTEQPRAERLCKALRNALRSEVQSRDEWVRKTADQPLYESGTVAKLILFAATHNSYPDPEGGGLIAAGKEGTLNLFAAERWNDLTIEHIAPNRKSEGWDAKLYDQDLKDRLGNLTLLPLRENSSMGTKPWPHKRLLYGILSTPSQDALTKKMAEAEVVGLKVAASTSELISSARLHPQLESLAAVTSDWSSELIERRSKRIAELAWDQLAPWMGIDGTAV